jgi:anti-sigma regulatory factor (Ser/Thr protein kinase)
VAGRERSLDLPHDLTSVGRARRFVRSVLAEWGLPELADDAELGTSELVANAVRYAGTDLTLVVRWDHLLTVAVRDGRPELCHPAAADPGALAEGGRGLQIVAAISRDWGVTAAGGGKVVWFALARPDRAGRDAEVVTLDRRTGPGAPSGPGRAGPGAARSGWRRPDGGPSRRGRGRPPLGRRRVGRGG